ncbi:hypothetical protein J0L31_11400 [Terrisporobacter glycolicus]|nr:hypothetical protein [Terrisporobacter glycolicus]
MYKNNNILCIKLDYLEGLFEGGYLEEKINELDKVGIKLVKFDKAEIPMKSFDDLTSVILMAINNEIVLQYVNGILACGIYDVLKKVIIDIWTKLNKKTYKKVYSSGEIEEKEATFGISMNINENLNVSFKLSGDISDELKEKCLDDAFELTKYLRENEVKSNYFNNYAKYDTHKQEWVLIDIKKEIEKLMSKQ